MECKEKTNIAINVGMEERLKLIHIPVGNCSGYSNTKNGSCSGVKHIVCGDDTNCIFGFGNEDLRRYWEATRLRDALV
jgi:hypothetical protein